MDESEIDLRGIFALLRRQLRLIAMVFVAVVGLAAFVVFALTPVYTASALVLVDPSRKNLLDPETQLSSSAADNARIDSEVEILRSDNVLLKVIEAEDLASNAKLSASLPLKTRILTFLHLSEPTLPTGQEALNHALSTLRNALTVQRKGLTYLISVQVRSEDPEQAARLANALSKAYIDDQVASKVNSILTSRDILQARISQARDAIAGSDGSFDKFINANIDRITRDTGRTDLAQTQRQIAQLAAARTQSLALANRLQSGIAEDDLQSVADALQSITLIELAKQRDALTARLASFSENAADLKAELADVETRLRSAASTELVSLQQTIANTETDESTKRQELRAAVLASSLSPDVLTSLYELQKNAELARSQYQTLLGRTNDLNAQADLQVADARIVSPALAPQTPSFPNKSLILALSALAALGIGAALAFLRENVVGGFTSEAQMASVLKTRVATAVPRQKVKSDKESLANLMVSAPLSIFPESVRRLRAVIEQSIGLGKGAAEFGEGKVVMVCSTAPDEGKTTLALSLARSYALSGRRALIIDCDLRKPSIHRHIGVERSQGLLEYLSAENSDNLNSIISRDTLTGATIVVGVRRSDLPTDQLLTGMSFGRLINAGKRSFDVVILDTPPIGPVTDGLYIAPFADAIVFVTRWASTSQLDVKEALASLTAAKAPAVEIIAVLNQQDETKVAYMRKYGSYYASAN